MLLVHGFTGTPFELRPQAEALAAAGFRARVMRLPGHGTTPRDLARCRFADWLGAVRSEHEALCSRCGGSGFLVGLSLGAMLVLLRAREQQDRVTALAALATPLRPGRHLLWAARLFRRSPCKPLIPLPRGRLRRDGFDTELIEQNPCYHAVPIGGIVELVGHLPELRDALPGIRVPALVAHGSRDSTALAAGGRETFERLGSADKVWLELKRSMHMITLDGERDSLSAAVVGFFNRIRGGEAPHA